MLKRWHPRRYLILGGVCLDTFRCTRSLVVGGKNRVQTRLRTVGGGGANVAIGVKHLSPDAEVLLLAATGDDRDGAEVRQQLSERGVTLPWGIVPGRVTSASCIVTATEDGRSTIFAETGARAEPLPLDLVEELIPRCDVCWLVAPTCNEQIRPILQMAARRQVPVFFGLGGAQVEGLGYGGLGQQLAGRVDLLICNRVEAAQMTSRARVDEQLDAMRYEEHVRAVVITDGTGGIHAWHEGRIAHVPAYSDPSCPVVDETGAGDAAQCVIGHWLLQDEPLWEALRAGVRQGFAAITMLGATTRLLPLSLLQSYLQETGEIAAA